MNTKLEANYYKHFREHPEGHIYINISGPCTINLQAPSSMSQEELNLYGEAMAKAISKIDLSQIIELRNKNS